MIVPVIVGVPFKRTPLLEPVGVTAGATPPLTAAEVSVVAVPVVATVLLPVDAAAFALESEMDVELLALGRNLPKG